MLVSWKRTGVRDSSVESATTIILAFTHQGCSSRLKYYFKKEYNLNHFKKWGISIVFMCRLLHIRYMEFRALDICHSWTNLSDRYLCFLWLLGPGWSSDVGRFGILNELFLLSCSSCFWSRGLTVIVQPTAWQYIYLYVVSEYHEENETR